MFKKDRSTLSNFSEAIRQEWIETNGLGGWTGSSVIGCHTRRYHGLLVAATKPPAERMSLVSRLDETVTMDGQRHELGVSLYPDAIIHPAGYQYLESFARDLFPEWVYAIGNVRLKKTITMVHGENTTLVLYEVLSAPSSFTLKLQPFLSVRGYHSLAHANNDISQNAQFNDGVFSTRAYEGTPEIFILIPGSEFHAHAEWYYHYNYSVEHYRGLDYEEDLFTHGHFSIELREGDRLGVIVSTENPIGRNAMTLLENERQRKYALLQHEPDDDIVRALALAADQFIVRRDLSDGSGGATVIAGYHWFTDWGRDTMISLPGLCLVTRRYDEAKKIIRAFAQSVSQGMLPNRFQDNNEPPEYNNVDGTLWYFIAVYKYLQYTNDVQFVLGEVLPVLKDIIDWHFRGTRYNIHADDDALLFAGEEGQQLTWMDARIGSWVVTPRMGKPVEIQALWYNCLRIFAEFLFMNGQTADAAIVSGSADRARDSFREKFWYADGNYLYDVIDEHNTPDASLRPNQLFAISLPFALVDGDKASAILQIVEEKLYTPVGLRSLSPDDPRYVPVYGGDAWHRDSSYHQGTVWSWLLGPYIESMIRITGNMDKSRSCINAFKCHLNEAGIGTVSEILDAREPHYPRGCIAQAWGVAEILRVIKEHHLYDLPANTEQEMVTSTETAADRAAMATFQNE